MGFKNIKYNQTLKIVLNNNVAHLGSPKWGIAHLGTKRPLIVYNLQASKIGILNIAQ